MATTVYSSFDKVDLSAFSAQPPRTMGKGRVVFLNGPNKHSTPKVTQAWPIRPADDKNEKFNLECSIGPDAVGFGSSLDAFDNVIRKMAFSNRKEWFGKRADIMTDEKDLLQLQTRSLKKGGESKTGTRYDDTVRFKVEGWKDHLDEVIYKDAATGATDDAMRMPRDCTWRPRLVDENGRGGPKDNETQFFLAIGKDMTTGIERFVNKVPCIDAAGNHIKDSKGNLVWEFVGPKHCRQGHKLTVVFATNLVWLSDGKFGVKLAAREVYITPTPPKAKGRIEGIEVVNHVDPFLAAKAVQLTTSADDVEGDVPDASSEPDAAPDAVAAPVAAPQPDATGDGPIETVGKKRAAASSPVAALKKRITLKATGKVVDEQF